MIKKSNGFTIIEILIVIGVLATLLVTVGSIMFLSFKGKSSTESNELMSSRAVFVLGEMKKNILNARVGEIDCPVGIGSSISFETKDGGMTTLLCDEATGQIASQSANGNFLFLDPKVKINNCDNFVSCEIRDDLRVLSVGFSLSLSVGTSGEIGNTGVFYGQFTPRE